MNSVCPQYCFPFLELSCFLIYPRVEVTLSVTPSNVTVANNLLLNSYFKNSIVGLHVLYVLNNAYQYSCQSIIIYHSIHKLIFYALF